MKTTLITTAALLCLSAGAQAAPIDYTFQQTGFEEGASVTGSFTAEDLDSSGQVSLEDGEIFDFSLSFSGNSVLEAFDLVFGDLLYFAYNLDGSLGESFDEESIDAVGADFQYVSGPWLYGQCGIGFDCAFAGGPTVSESAFSSELINVDLASTEVPEPAAGLMLLTGLLGAGLLLQRRRA